MRPWLLRGRSRMRLGPTAVWRLCLNCSNSFAGSGNEQGRLGFVTSVSDSTAGTILIQPGARPVTSMVRCERRPLGRHELVCCGYR